MQISAPREFFYQLASMTAPLIFCDLQLKMGILLAIAVLLSYHASGSVAPAADGPCSTYIGATNISVSTTEDLYKRLDYPSTTTIRLLLQQDLRISSTITFSEGFSCTIFTTKGSTPLSVIMDDDATGPVLAVWNVSNVLVQNINFRLPLSEDSPPCKASLPLTGGPILCPAIYIYKSWGIQIVKSTNIMGRIDILASTQIWLDSLTITTLLDDRAAVDFANVGDGPNRIPANVSVTNCNITGGFIGAMIGRASVGVVIANNFFFNQQFTAVQCGAGARNVGDCMLSQISNNYITVTPDCRTTSDSAAIYFASHWVNPGNRVTCNYAVGGKQCMYLDWASSGVIVDGMVCLNTTSGLKLNTGHSNRISSFLIINNNLPGWISCQNYELNNCLHESGQAWDIQRLGSYNSPGFQKDYPWLNNFCNLTKFNGVNCNPPTSAPASKTGACSGLPTGNDVQLVIVDPRKPKNTPTYLSCNEVPVVSSLNSINYTSPAMSSKTIQFKDYANSDLGLLPSSPVYSMYPKFRSCAKSANGIQKVAKETYLSRYNVLPGVLVPDL